jgi:hypothetical protein
MAALWAGRLKQATAPGAVALEEKCQEYHFGIEKSFL